MCSFLNVQGCLVKVHYKSCPIDRGLSLDAVILFHCLNLKNDRLQCCKPILFRDGEPVKYWLLPTMNIKIAHNFLHYQSNSKSERIVTHTSLSSRHAVHGPLPLLCSM